MKHYTRTLTLIGTSIGLSAGSLMGKIHTDYTFGGGSSSSVDSEPSTTAGDFMPDPTGSLGSPGTAGLSTTSSNYFIRANGTSSGNFDGAVAADEYGSFTVTTGSSTETLNGLYMTASISGNSSRNDFNIGVVAIVPGEDPIRLGVIRPNGTPDFYYLALESELLVDVPAATQVEFRLYFFDDSSFSSRIYRLDGIQVTTDDPVLDYELTGTSFDYFGDEPSATQTLTIINNGQDEDLTVRDFGLGSSLFTVSPESTFPFTVAPGTSEVFTISLSGLSAGETTSATIAIDTDTITGEFPMIEIEGSYTTLDTLAANSSFEILSPTGSVFEGWNDSGGVTQAPGLISGSDHSALLSGGDLLSTELGAGVSSSEIDFYFAINDSPGNRLFNVLLYTETGGSSPVNIIYQDGTFQSFQNGAFATILTPSEALLASIDGNDNGSLNDIEDTSNVYMLRITTEGWGASGAFYCIEVFDALENSLGKSANITTFRTDNNAGDPEASLLSSIFFSSQFGSNPGFWVDELSVSGSLAPPADLVITGASRSGDLLTLTFSGPAGVPDEFTVASSESLIFGEDTATVETAVTEGEPGVYTVVLDVSSDGPKHFYRIER